MHLLQTHYLPAIKYILSSLEKALLKEFTASFSSSIVTALPIKKEYPYVSGDYLI